MFRKPLLAFAGVAALSALAFAPLVNPGTVASADGKARAVAAGADLTVDDGDVQRALEQTEALAGVDCVLEMAGPFACNNVDLVDVVPTATFGGGHGSDSWGWTAEDGTEIVIVTSGNGVGFFRLEDDDTTSYLGTLALSAIEPTGVLWHDVKVVNDHAYITAEDGGYGIQIVDLTDFVEAPAIDPLGGVEQTIAQDGFLGGVQGHNMVAFPERDLIGIVLGEESECGGNLVFYDVAVDPLNPEKVGCIGQDAGLGYVETPHDAHCVVYHGPDADYNGAGADGTLGTDDDVEPSDICALFNQYDGGLIIMDATAVTRDRTATRGTFVNRFDYGTANYTHQGWFTDNHRWVLFNDELDESGALALGLGGSAAGTAGNNTNTTTYWVDLSDLDVAGVGMASADGYNADKVKQWSNPNTIAIDHNMYPVGNFLYQANYGAGMRVLEFSDESLAGDPATAFEEVAYFDTYPGPGPSEFYGAWNVYPFFESGKVVLSDFQSGLLVLDVHDEVYED